MSCMMKNNLLEGRKHSCNSFWIKNKKSLLNNFIKMLAVLQNELVSVRIERERERKRGALHSKAGVEIIVLQDNLS